MPNTTPLETAELKAASKSLRDWLASQNLHGLDAIAVLGHVTSEEFGRLCSGKSPELMIEAVSSFCLTLRTAAAVQFLRFTLTKGTLK